MPSTQKEFWIPEELVDKGQVDALCRLLEQCVGANYPTKEFVIRGQLELRWEDTLTEHSVIELYEKIQQLEAEGRDGLWARIIKNSFAPVFRSALPFDYLVGPPLGQLAELGRRLPEGHHRVVEQVWTIDRARAT